jgi:hypothetical protein
MDDEFKQRAKDAGQWVLDKAFKVIGIVGFSLFLFLRGMFGGIISFFIGLIFLYFFLGFIGFILCHVFSALCHAYLGH